MTLRTVVLSIQALLTSPQPDDPQDAVVAQQVHHALPYHTTPYYTVDDAQRGCVQKDGAALDACLCRRLEEAPHNMMLPYFFVRTQYIELLLFQPFSLAARCHLQYLLQPQLSAIFLTSVDYTVLTARRLGGDE